MALSLNLGPRYRALSLLAKGGMGAVYLGQVFDNNDGDGDGDREPQLVAIKVMHEHIADSEDAIAMFIDEARIGTRIHHPNVVRVIDTDVANDTPFIVMEYVEGLSWSRLLRRFSELGESVPADLAARVVHDVLLGLEAAHAVDAVHRDVSPHNIIVGVDGRAHITDFGVATFSGRIAGTAPGGIRGKVQYMSPEQVVRSGVDGRADVFSAGVVLWEGLTGRELFQSATQADTLAKVLKEPIPPPSSFATDVSMELEDVCLQALERSKERRYQSAKQFAEALAGAIVLASPEQVTATVCRLGADTLAFQREARLAAVIVAKQPRELPTLQMIRPVTVPARDPDASSKERESASPARRGMTIAAGAVALLLLGTIIGRSSSSPSPSPSPSSSSSAGNTTPQNEVASTPSVTSVFHSPQPQPPPASITTTLPQESVSFSSPSPSPSPPPPPTRLPPPRRAPRAQQPHNVASASTTTTTTTTTTPPINPSRKPPGDAPFVPGEL